MTGNSQNRLKYIWKFGKKYIVFFIIAEICIIVSYAVSVLLPMNLTRLTDRVLYGNDFEILGSVIRDYCFLFFISTIFNFIYAFVWQYLNNHYVLDVKNELYVMNSTKEIINAIITEENNEDEFLYLIYHTYYNNDVGKNILIKINLKNKENLFKTELDIDNLITISFWNKNYLLLFEIKSTIMHLFNTKTCRIEKKFINNKGNGLFTGKKLVINNNEQLLFVLDVNGNLNLWINE